MVFCGITTPELRVEPLLLRVASRPGAAFRGVPSHSSLSRGADPCSPGAWPVSKLHPHQATAKSGRRGGTQGLHCTSASLGRRNPGRWLRAWTSVAPWTALPAHEHAQAPNAWAAVDSRLRRCGSLPTSPKAFDQKHPKVKTGRLTRCGVPGTDYCQTGFSQASMAPVARTCRRRRRPPGPGGTPGARGGGAQPPRFKPPAGAEEHTPRAFGGEWVS